MSLDFRLGTLYALPKSVLIGILILNIGRLTGSNYKKNYLTKTHYKKKIAYSIYHHSTCLLGILYALPKGVLIGILFLNIGRLTGSNYKKIYLTGTHYKKKLPYRNLSSLIRRSNHLYFGKPFADTRQ